MQGNRNGEEGSGYCCAVMRGWGKRKKEIVSGNGKKIE
jgi:hypothetical protein